MTISYLLLVLGMLLIFLEFFLPGAVMGTIGALLVIAGIFTFASETTSTRALICYLLLVCVALYYVIKLAIWRILTTKSENTIYSAGSQVGYVASSFDSSLIGMEGVVISDLKPGGYILVDGKKVQALSVAGYYSGHTN